MNADAPAYAREGAMLTEAHLALIQASAIDPTVSRERGYRTETVKARLRDKGFSPAQCRQGLLIPMFNALGECNNYQLRPDEPRLDSVGKPVKYETCFRGPLTIDVPWRLSRPRKIDQQTPFDLSELPPMIMDVTVPLIVTEGVRKADSAVSRGLCCIALMGVSAWHRLPDWNDFPIKNRTVYVCFDSDAMQKRPVWIQLRDLKEWLETHGAKVFVIHLLPGPHGEKVGLDDFVASLVTQDIGDDEVRARLFALATDEPRKPEGATTTDSGPAASEIPSNFKLTDDTLYILRERTNKYGGEVEIVEEPVCSGLKVAALTRDDSGGEWGRLLGFRDPDGHDHEWAMPTEMLAGDGTEYRARLLEQGLIIWPGREARYGLHEYIGGCRPKARARAVTRVGWHDQMFVLPTETFGSVNGERTLYQCATQVAHSFNARGSLEDWQRETAALCDGNSRLVFAASTALAAPLLYLTGDESGGFHFVGMSSLGKTTALRVAGSAWGGSATPSGYLRQWRATSNGLEGIAALHSDTLLCLDELSEVNAREAGNIAYMLANGQGKSRARQDGSARRAFAWRIIFLSSGEITLADKVREDARQEATAGQSVRVLDIPADAGAGFGLFENLHDSASGQHLADRLKAATQSYYGAPMRAFLSEIVKRPNNVADAIKKFREEFIAEHSPAGADGQVLRAAMRFGLVAAAGELATAFQITGWNEGAATWAAGTCFGAWLVRRGHAGPAEIEAGIEQVRRFFALHGESRFSNGSNDRPVLNRAGFRKDACYWVFPEVFRAEIARGFEWRSLANALAERKMLIRGSDGKLQRLVRNPDDNKPIRMLCFMSAVLGTEELTEQEDCEDAL